MKNISLLKKVTLVLTILIALLLLAQTALTFIPYFTITPVGTMLNPNPDPDTYSIFDLCWVDTITITTYFEKTFQELSLKTFKINEHVIAPVLTMVLGLAMIICGIVFEKDELNQYPSMVSGILLQIFSLLWVPISIGGYTGATILYLDQFVKTDNILPAASMVRSTSVILIVITSVLVMARLASWITTLVLEKKARDARIAAEEAVA